MWEVLCKLNYQGLLCLLLLDSVSIGLWCTGLLQNLSKFLHWVVVVVSVCVCVCMLSGIKPSETNEACPLPMSHIPGLTICNTHDKGTIAPTHSLQLPCFLLSCSLPHYSKSELFRLWKQTKKKWGGAEISGRTDLIIEEQNKDFLFQMTLLEPPAACHLMVVRIWSWQMTRNYPG